MAQTELRWPLHVNRAYHAAACSKPQAPRVLKQRITYLAPKPNGKADSLHCVGVPTDEEAAKENAIEVIPAQTAAAPFVCLAPQVQGTAASSECRNDLHKGRQCWLTIMEQRENRVAPLCIQVG